MKWYILIVTKAGAKFAVGPFDSARDAADFSSQRLMLREGTSAVIEPFINPDEFSPDKPLVL